jgi:hypothetical protein
MNPQNTFLEGCFVIDIASSGYSFAVSAYGHDEKSVVELCLIEGLFNNDADAEIATVRPMTEDDYLKYQDNLEIFAPEYSENLEA